MAIKKLDKKKCKLIVEKGRDINGKRIRVTETFIGLKSEAETRLVQMKIEIKGGNYIQKKNLTINTYFNEWLKIKEKEVSPKTYSTYKLYTKNILQYLGHIELININVKLLKDFYAKLAEEKEISQTTIRHHYSILNTALNEAIILGYINNNPNQKIKKPKASTIKQKKCYSADEVSILLSNLKNENLKYQAIIYLALDSGCRRGELTGLTWEDINFNENTININKATQYLSGKGIFEKSTKSDTSNRKVYISETTANILKQYKHEQLMMKFKLGSKWKNSKRVFTTDDGDDIHPDTPSKIFYKIIKKYNLPKISFHGLRHTSISLLIQKGIQPQIISKKAGHSSISVTHDIYSHFFDNEFKETANVMNEILS